MKLQVIDPNRQLRASSLHRTFKCMASAVLPSVDRETEYGSRGTAKHARLEGNREFITKLLSEQGFPEIDQQSFMFEQPLAFDVSTGRAETGYEFNTIYGTPDGACCTTDGRSMIVWDLKTGDSVPHP